MAKQTVNIGAAPDDGTGDALRTALSKINDNFDELYTDVSARVTHTTSQSLANSAYTTLVFDTETFDSGGLHDPTTNSARFTSNDGGLFVISGTCEISANATGRRILRIMQGVTERARQTVMAITTSGGTTVLNVTTVMRLAAAEYVTLEVFQDSGGALNAFGSATHFSIARLAL